MARRKFKSGEKKKKSLLRRILKWTGITFLILLVLIILLPFIFKDQIIQMVKDEVNKNLNAKVDFGEFDLSIFSTFPNFGLEINDVTVDGIDRFEGVRLAGIKKTEVSLDLMSVIFGDKIEINDIAITEPTFNVMVDKEGFANYDIAKSDSTATPEEPQEESKFSLGLKSLTVRKANIIYDDQFGDMFSQVTNMDVDLEGDFTQDIFDVTSKTIIEELTYRMGGVNYMKNNKIDLTANVNIDKFTKYTLKENNLKINELDLGFDGWIEMLEESMKMDMTFASKQTAFKNILSLVPAVYLTDFSGIDTKGELAFNGFMKGEMVGDEMPEFNIDLDVTKGYFKYPDLPNAMTNINIDANINHPQGDLDKMKISIPKFHMEMAANPIDATLKLSNPLTDPNIASTIVAHIDLAKLKTVMPMAEGEDYTGKIDADLTIAGRLSSLEKEEYENFKADGVLGVKEMLYKSPDLAYDVLINTMDMSFSPQFVTLSAFDSKLGKSDLKLDGRIDNILHYVLKGDILKGTFNLASTSMDIDELMSEPVTQNGDEVVATNQDEATTGVFEVPGSYDMSLNTNITTLIYDGLAINNIKGNVGVKDQVATMNNVSMNTMGGTVSLNGAYNTQKVDPLVDFKYNIKNVDIEQVVKYFNSVETLAPIAKKCKGSISTNMDITTTLDQTMSPIFTTLSGLGGLSSNSLTVAGVKVLDKLSDVLKIKDIAQQTLNNLNLSFSFEEGKAIVKPFTTKISGMNTNISGYTAFDQTIKYDMLMEVPKARLGNQANDVMAGLVGKASSQGLDINIPDLIPVKVTIGGTVTDPKIQTDLKGKATDFVNDIKDKVIDTLKKTFNNEIDKILADAQAQADKIRAEAKVQADKLRAEGKTASAKAKEEAIKAADKLKEEAYKSAQDVENSAKNPLEKLAKQKAADEMRKTADKKYDDAVKKADEKASIPQNEANQKADKIEDEADKQAQKVLDAAQVKANQIKQ